MLRQYITQWMFNVLVALDQLLNALLGGWPDETLSSRAWRTESKGRALGALFRPMIDFIFLPWEKNHCKTAWESELYRRQYPSDYQSYNAAKLLCGGSPTCVFFERMATHKVAKSPADPEQ